MPTIGTTVVIAADRVDFAGPAAADAIALSAAGVVGNGDTLSVFAGFTFGAGGAALVGRLARFVAVATNLARCAAVGDPQRLVLADDFLATLIVVDALAAGAAGRVGSRPADVGGWTAAVRGAALGRSIAACVAAAYFVGATGVCLNAVAVWTATFATAFGATTIGLTATCWFAGSAVGAVVIVRSTVPTMTGAAIATGGVARTWYATKACAATLPAGATTVVDVGYTDAVEADATKAAPVPIRMGCALATTTGLAGTGRLGVIGVTSEESTDNGSQ